MKDFSFWEEYEGTPEGNGRSEKIWLMNPDTGQTGLFKFKKDISMTDYVSECIAYDLANIMGFLVLNLRLDYIKPEKAL